VSLATPKLIVIAGPNGSGKTSVTSQILEHEWIEGCVYVNPDNIARDVFGDWNSPDAVVRAAVLAGKMREDCLGNKESLLFETVLSAPDKLDFMRRAKEAGYFVRLFFVGTNSPAISAARIAQRVMEGGHDVPIAKVISRYSKSIANCAIAAGRADRTYVYDNSIDFANPRLLFRVNDGKLEKVYAQINPWADEIFKSITG
jgi:predicted ABC-type ATPase